MLLIITVRNRAVPERGSLPKKGREREKITHHSSHRSFPGDGLLQLQQTEADLRSAAASIQSLSPCSQSRRDLTFKTGSRKAVMQRHKRQQIPAAVKRNPGPRSPDDIHGMLLPRGWCQRSQAHHLRWVPERFLQVAPFDVPLKVRQAQHRQVQRVSGDARKAGPLLLRSNNPVIVRVGIVFVVLEVVTCGIWVWDCVGLQKHGGRDSEFTLQ